MSAVMAATQEDLRHFCELISIPHGPDLRGMKLVTKKGIEALCGFNNWTPNSVQVHIWCGGHMTRYFLQEIFKYLFITQDRGIAIGCIPGDNTASVEFSRRAGFRTVHEVPDGWTPGTSMVIQELRKEDCIWIRGLYGKKLSPAPRLRTDAVVRGSSTSIH